MKTKNHPAMTIGVEKETYPGLKQLAASRGMKLRAIPTVLMRGWQLLTPQQQSKAFELYGHKQTA